MIVADEIADPEFGTGCVKITPAHDANDFECGKRHSLPFITVIDDKGYMNSEAGPFAVRKMLFFHFHKIFPNIFKFLK